MNRAIAALVCLSAGCRALVLTSEPGQVNEVVVAATGSVGYASLGPAGISIFDTSSGAELARVAPPPGLESVDDLALADGLLFALDARAPGAVCALALEDPRAPRACAPGVPAPVGPFSGVSAGGGRVVVSGGTSPLTAREYDPSGALGPARVHELAYGHPDALVAPDGRRAFVSIHASALRGTYGVALLDLARGAPAGRLLLEGAGFTPGATRPSSFPIGSALLEPDTLLVAHGAGLAVIDVAEPDRPRLVTVRELPVRAVKVAVRGTTAAVVGSDPAPTLVLLDLSDRRAPSIERVLALPVESRPTGVALTARTVLVAAHGPRPLVYPR